jgi:hypothetical protein
MKTLLAAPLLLSPLFKVLRLCEPFFIIFWGFFVFLSGYAESGILSAVAFWIGMG